MKIWIFLVVCFLSGFEAGKSGKGGDEIRIKRSYFTPSPATFGIGFIPLICGIANLFCPPGWNPRSTTPPPTNTPPSAPTFNPPTQNPTMPGPTSDTTQHGASTGSTAAGQTTPATTAATTHASTLSPAPGR